MLKGNCVFLERTRKGDIESIILHIKRKAQSFKCKIKLCDSLRKHTAAFLKLCDDIFNDKRSIIIQQETLSLTLYPMSC